MAARLPVARSVNPDVVEGPSTRSVSGWFRGRLHFFYRCGMLPFREAAFRRDLTEEPSSPDPGLQGHAKTARLGGRSSVCSEPTLRTPGGMGRLALGG